MVSVSSTTPAKAPQLLSLSADIPLTGTYFPLGEDFAPVHGDLRAATPEESLHSGQRLMVLDGNRWQPVGLACTFMGKASHLLTLPPEVFDELIRLQLGKPPHQVLSAARPLFTLNRCNAMQGSVRGAIAAQDRAWRNPAAATASPSFSTSYLMKRSASGNTA